MGLLHILRRLGRLPMFTGLMVLTLAIGIGATTAIFSLIEGVVLKPLPYPRAGELIALDHTAPGINIPDLGIAPFLYFSYRQDARSFQDVGMWRGERATLTGIGQPEEVAILTVTDGVLPLLGARPLLGRLFSKSDDGPESPETAVLMHTYWRTKFGADSGVVGRQLVLDGRPREVIGVLPETFRFLDDTPSVVLPLRYDPQKTTLGQFNYRGLARLKPGVSLEQASAEVAPMIPATYQRFPPPPGYSVRMFEEARIGPFVRPLKDRIVGDDITLVLWTLMGTVGIVWLIACANVANLLLVRVEGRQHELAIRAALGAGRGRIARELLAESLTLGALGGVAGLALAYGGLQILAALAPANLPRAGDIAIDGPVLVFTLIVSLFAGLLFGAIPVLKFAGPRLGLALRSEGRGVGQSRQRHRARSALVVAQVALAVILLVSSGLMIRTFQALRNVDPGFSDPKNVQTLWLAIPNATVSDPSAVFRMERDILDKLAAIPGVTSVGAATVLPMDGDGWRDPLFAEDRSYAEKQLAPIRLYKFISPGLLTTMGARLVAGRDFTWTDATEKRLVVLISENLARELWGEPQAAIGKRVRESLAGRWREVIGVVSDERHDGLNQKPTAIAYWPLILENFSGNDEISVRRNLAYVLRTSRAGSAALLTEINQAVWSVNANLPVVGVRTLQEIYDRSLSRTSFTLVMLAIAGTMALLLGVSGLYGVISYSVSQRTREIGIRLALGARHGEVTGLFVRHGARLAAAGIACGLAAASALSRFMSSMLFEVTPIDPLTYVGVSLALAAAAVLASYVPALRATMVNPATALRQE